VTLVVSAVAEMTRCRVVGKHPDRAEVAVGARLAVDARREGLAAVADSAAEELAMDVHAQPQVGHGLVVVAVVRVFIAVALLALKRVGSCVPSPRFLCVTILALVAVDSSCLVLTIALQDAGLQLGLRADVSMPVANTPSSNTYFLDCIVVSPSHSVVALCN